MRASWLRSVDRTGKYRGAIEYNGRVVHACSHGHHKKQTAKACAGRTINLIKSGAQIPGISILRTPTPSGE